MRGPFAAAGGYAPAGRPGNQQPAGTDARMGVDRGSQSGKALRCAALLWPEKGYGVGLQIEKTLHLKGYGITLYRAKA